MKNTSLTYRDCPVCGCTEKQSLCQIRLAPVADENLPPDFHVASCTRCGFCFDDMAACQEDFDAYYANTIKYQHPDTCGSGSLSEAECERYKRVFSACRQHIRDTSYLLDIGAGKGGLLRYIANERERGRERERERERDYMLLNRPCVLLKNRMAYNFLALLMTLLKEKSDLILFSALMLWNIYMICIHSLKK